MNVFILNTGRCGSTTIIKACQYITNYTSAHESRCHMVGDERLNYPQNHIESDNRLSWFLGRLDQKFGDQAIYVHLVRNREKTANSYFKRSDFGIIKAYLGGIMQRVPVEMDRQLVALDYCDTVNINIAHFLRDKTRKMVFEIENGAEDFRKFWELIGAQGDLEKAVAQFDRNFNASGSAKGKNKPWKPGPVHRVVGKVTRVIKGLPNFIRHA